MSYGLICEDCGCPFFYQDEDGYYCEDCERYYSFYEAFTLLGIQEYRREMKVAKLKTVFLTLRWMVRWNED